MEYNSIYYLLAVFGRAILRIIFTITCPIFFFCDLFKFYNTLNKFKGKSGSFIEAIKNSTAIDDTICRLEDRRDGIKMVLVLMFIMLTLGAIPLEKPIKK